MFSGSLLDMTFTRTAVALTTALILLTGCDTTESPVSGPPVTVTTSSAPTTLTPPAKPEGNGVTSQSWETILDRVTKATGAARSVRMKGTMKEGGTTTTMDLQVARPGLGSGYVISGRDRVDLIRIGSTIYVKSGRKWLKGSVKDKDLKGIADIASLAFLAQLVAGVTEEEGSLTKGERTVINGRPALALVGTDGKLFVATEGEPHALRLAATDRSLQLDFLAYNAKVDIKPPPRSRVVVVP